MIPKIKVPKFRRNPDGRAFAQYPGSKKREYFGKYDDPMSHAKYKSWLIRIIDSPQPTAPELQSGSLLIELSAVYLRHAKSYLQGKGDWNNVRGTQALLDEFAGDVLGSAFGPVRFEQFREWLVGRGLARTTINSHMGRVRRFFRWCQSKELIPKGHLEGLKSVIPLMPGRTLAREPEPVAPVAWAVVERTIPHLPPPIVNAIKVQYYCGMRPGEVLRMRSGEIDQRGDIWFWKPGRHKNSHRLQSLTKAIPAPAQKILAPLLKKPAGEHLFSPVDAKDWAASRRRPRVTKIYPYERIASEERGKNPKRKRLDHYTESRYGKLISEAIARANKDVPEEERIPRWTPLQLRHAIATEVSALLGEQASQRWLGHARMETTAIYTAQHERELREIAEKLAEHLPG
ncbi:MAG: site-specific integrase [Planctomycetes bacterium]|nr:site-specific integrase [Planctomycetota bacterium]